MSLNKKLGLLVKFFKKTVFAQILLVVVFVLALVFFNWSFETVRGPVPSQSDFALLLFEFDDGQRVFEGEVLPNMTVLEALYTSSNAGNINLRFEISENGQAKLMELDGYSLEKRQVFFYLNSKPIKQEDIHKTTVNPGDRITVHIE